MPMFAVNRYLPGLTATQLRVLHRALTEAARRVSADGPTVQYVRSTYVPARNQCVCVFTADTADAVVRANEIAQVPFTNIDEAVDLVL
jgi:7-cyano-7-deazaguanine synthase in queuosine biosynthesis